MPETPDRAGRYVFERELGEGALGLLSKARIASGAEAGRTVTARRIPREGLDEDVLDRISNVGFSAMEVRDPKVVAVLDIVVAESEVAVVSEFVDGLLLKELLAGVGGKRQPFPRDAALRIALDALEAMQSAKRHWSEIYDPEDEQDGDLARAIYGGISPETLLVADFGETMLTDIGVAGIAKALPSFTEHPDTLAYRAPELLAPDAVSDEQSDIFTIGVMVWEMIVGRPLFAPTSAAKHDGKFAESAQMSTVRRKVEKAAIPRLDRMPLIKGPASKELADVAANALERDRSKRFSTFEDMADAIQQLGDKAIATPDKVSAFVARAQGKPTKSARAPAAPGDETAMDTRMTIHDAEQRDVDTEPPPASAAAAEVAEAMDVPEVDSVEISPDEVEELSPSGPPASAETTPPGDAALSDAKALFSSPPLAGDEGGDSDAALSTPATDEVATEAASGVSPRRSVPASTQPPPVRSKNARLIAIGAIVVVLGIGLFFATRSEAPDRRSTSGSKADQPLKPKPLKVEDEEVEPEPKPPDPSTVTIDGGDSIGLATAPETNLAEILKAKKGEATEATPSPQPGTPGPKPETAKPADTEARPAPAPQKPVQASEKPAPAPQKPAPAAEKPFRPTEI